MKKIMFRSFQKKAWCLVRITKGKHDWLVQWGQGPTLQLELFATLTTCGLGVAAPAGQLTFVEGWECEVVWSPTVERVHLQDWGEHLRKIGEITLQGARTGNAVNIRS